LPLKKVCRWNFFESLKDKHMFRKINFHKNFMETRSNLGQNSSFFNISQDPFKLQIDIGVIFLKILVCWWLGSKGQNLLHNQANSWTVYQIVLIFCIKLKGHAWRKITEPYFLEKFLFPWKQDQKVKFWPKFNIFQWSVYKIFLIFLRKVR